MGCRITDNLKRSHYNMSYVETAAEGRARLGQRNITPVEQDQVLGAADAVILAVPDVVIGKVADVVVPQLQAGATVLLLDPAAAYLGQLPARGDVSYFVTHPCHPPLFGEEDTPEARADHFGGIAAKQAIVCALMQGPDAAYAPAAELASTMYAPVTASHRITVEQMAMLEPTMAETVAASCAVVMKEAMDEAVRRGVPEAAARDFMLGHAKIALAIAFGAIDSPFSDAAKVAIAWGKQRIIHPDWKRVFDSDQLADNIDVMLHPGKLSQ